MYKPGFLPGDKALHRASKAKNPETIIDHDKRIQKTLRGLSALYMLWGGLETSIDCIHRWKTDEETKLEVVTRGARQIQLTCVPILSIG